MSQYYKLGFPKFWFFEVRVLLLQNIVAAKPMVRYGFPNTALTEIDLTIEAANMARIAIFLLTDIPRDPKNCRQNHGKEKFWENGLAVCDPSMHFYSCCVILFIPCTIFPLPFTGNRVQMRHWLIDWCIPINCQFPFTMNSHSYGCKSNVNFTLMELTFFRHIFSLI